MIVAGIYSFNSGREVMEEQYSKELVEIYTAIERIDAAQHLTKQTKEKSRAQRGLLYSPKGLNRAFKELLYPDGWHPIKESCAYSTKHYVAGYTPPLGVGKGAYREMDFVKNHVGIEVQFGKYAFMVYNVAAKMTIFSNLRHIKVGVEIVPVKEMQASMSTGVAYFEQFIWDLETRGVSNIDVPVLVLAISPRLADESTVPIHRRQPLETPRF